MEAEKNAGCCIILIERAGMAEVGKSCSNTLQAQTGEGALARLRAYGSCKNNKEDLRMKKRWMAIALAGVMAGSVMLGGCSSSHGQKQTAGKTGGTENAVEEKSTSASDSAWKPDGPITVICPYGAGGGQDVAARIFAKYAEKYAGVKFVVDNRTGGSGTIGTMAIANAKPDGYTLGMFHNLSLYDQYLVDGVTYNENSFVQLAIFAADSTVIVVNKKLGVDSINGLVDLAKEKPGKITWGGPEYSSQTYPRMNVENATGVSFGKMIFDGGASSLAAVAGGNCDVTSVFPSEYMAMSDNPDIVAIATCGKERMAALPDIPTMMEQGVDATFYQWRSYVAPAGVSQEIIDFYDGVFEQTVADPDFQKELKDGGFNLLEKAGHEAATQYMLEDFKANKDAIMKAAGKS